MLISKMIAKFSVDEILENEQKIWSITFYLIQYILTADPGSVALDKIRS